MTVAPPPNQHDLNAPVRSSLTRQDALAGARATYQQLVARALLLDGVDAVYVAALASEWTAHLDFLARFRSDASIADEVHAALRFVSENAIATPSDDGDGLVRWVDAYPSAVADLFPPSALTFKVVARSPLQGAVEKITRDTTAA